MVVIDKNVIIDASVVLAWLLPNEVYKNHANQILELYKLNKIKICTPQLHPYEVTNGILSAFLSKRVSEEIANKQLLIFKNLQIQTLEIDQFEVFKIAIKYKLSAYDASYIALMNLKDGLFITADRKFFSKIKKSYKSVIWIENVTDLVKN